MPSKSKVILPLNVNKIIGVWAIDINIENNPLIFGTDEYTNDSFVIAGRRIDMVSNLWFRWFSLCI